MSRIWVKAGVSWAGGMRPSVASLGSLGRSEGWGKGGVVMATVLRARTAIETGVIAVGVTVTDWRSRLSPGLRSELMVRALRVLRACER